MGSQGEKQTYDVGKEKHDRSKPAVRPDSFHEEVVIECRYLAEVASSAVSIWFVVKAIYGATGIADKLML